MEKLSDLEGRCRGGVRQDDIFSTVTQEEQEHPAFGGRESHVLARGGRQARPTTSYVGAGSDAHQSSLAIDPSFQLF